MFLQAESSKTCAGVQSCGLNSDSRQPCSSVVLTHSSGTVGPFSD